jgi:hypothetical protein
MIGINGRHRLRLLSGIQRFNARFERISPFDPIFIMLQVIVVHG